MLTREPEFSKDFPPAAYESWRRLVDADLKGASFEKKLITHTYEGILIRPLYTRADWPDAGERAGFSGVWPYTRGARELGNAGAGWDIRQEHGSAMPADLNSAILDDLAHGVTSVLVRLDAASRVGLDPDAPTAGDLVGADGAMLYTPADWTRAFEGVHLGMIHVSLEAGAGFVPAAAQLSALWERSGVPWGEARGAFNADPLAVLAREGTLPADLDVLMAQMGELVAWASAHLPHVSSVRVGTAAYHHAGATATQDLAFALATGVEYLRALTGRGIGIDAASRQMLFSFAVGTNFFLAIAKLRAARRLWARVVRACGGSEDAGRMRMHVRPSKRVMSERDPWVNILRNSVCVFAGGVAGADAVGSLPFDAPLGEPSELGRRLARNTQVILQEECHLHRINDPAGGCWYLESLTDELCEKSLVIFRAIESRGGMSEALRTGWIGEQIAAAYGPRARNVATRRDAMVGVSEFPNVGEQSPPVVATDRATLKREAIAAARSARAAALENHAGGVAGAMAAARRGATVGQIALMLGIYNADGTTLTEPIVAHPFAEAFERLRDQSDAHLAATGRRPRVFLASVGPASQHLARTNYAANFFEAGGFETLGGDGIADAGSAARAFAASEAAVAVICSSDAAYPTLVPELAPALHRAGARTVVLAGNPGEREAEFRAAGVDRFIYVRCDVVDTLRTLLHEEGVRS